MAFEMDLRDLRYFETIAELQHVGRAAERLHRTQPALTSAIRRLEEVCGAPLFEREGRGIRLSPAGELLLKWAQRMRFNVEDARREISDFGKGLSGSIRIGAVPTAAQFLIPLCAKQLIAEAPQVSLKIVVGLIDTLKPLVRAGEIDLMVGTEVEIDQSFVSKPLAEDQIVVVASRTHELFQGKPTLADLSRHCWVLQPPGAPTRDWLDQTFLRCGLPCPKVKIESSMLVMLPAMVSETGMLSFISSHHLTPDGTLKEIKLRETTMIRKLAVTYRVDGYLSPAANRFIDILAQRAVQGNGLVDEGLT